MKYNSTNIYNIFTDLQTYRLTNLETYRLTNLPPKISK